MSTLRSYHPIRKQSDKARGRQAARAACIREVKKRDHYRCVAQIAGVCTHQPDDVHELVMRSAGGDPTDPTNCITVCRRCHDWIAANKGEACVLGLVRSPKHEARNG